MDTILKYIIIIIISWFTGRYWDELQAILRRLRKDLNKTGVNK